MDIIQNNAFRIIGMTVNSTAKERLASVSKIKAYARIGKDVSFPLDKVFALGKVSRTVEAVDRAVVQLNTQDDFLKNALFWFYTLTPEQEKAYQCIEAGNLKDAQKIYEKAKDFGSLIGLATLAFVNTNINQAIGYINTFFEDETAFNAFKDFVSQITRQETNLTVEDLLTLYLETLLENVRVSKLLKAYSSFKKSSEISKLSLEIVNRKNAETLTKDFKKTIAEKVEEIDKNPGYALKKCPEFIKVSKENLRFIAKSAGTNSVPYKDASDSLADYIIQVVSSYDRVTDYISPSDAKKEHDILRKAKALAYSTHLQNHIDDLLGQFVGIPF
ncbi:MAG: hypothetical protein IJU76_12925 [Desulfovibrionaceae bacterium]|nr:hypothetical protein [Desulfovibrionaceae bacterium]